MSNEQELQNVEQYKFEPIKGYPMLNWKGKRSYTSTQYYPAQLKESYGEPDENGWMNKIFWGDNLQVMSHLLKEYRGKVDLIYIDPPFDSKANYVKKIKAKGKAVENNQNVFEEKQYQDIWNNDEFLQFIYERLILCRELLSETGSIYVHCDWHKSHYIRAIIEEIFGIGGKDDSIQGFRNEIIWCYSDAANSKKYWNTKHDTIHFATKGTKWTFNYEEVFRPVKESTVKKYRYEDEVGKYRLFGKNIEGSPIRWHRDVSKEWEENHPELVFRHYLKEGSLPLDWWEINPVNQAAKERTDYPTQKPEELIERIIKASSNRGDLIFDCFMGSGTTQAVAMKLGRRFLGADINLGAIQTTTKRLLTYIEEIDSTQGFEVYNVNNYDLFRNPVEAKDLIIEALEIQIINNSSVFDGEKDGYMVKVLPINTIATKADLNDLITNLDYKLYEKKQNENPNQPVENILLVCMGHEPDLAAWFMTQIPYKLNVEVIDILRNRSDLEFKRDSEANINIVGNELIIENFYPLNLLQKLSIMKENVETWAELVESVMIDWNYDGAVLNPKIIDIPSKNQLVKGSYLIPEDAGTIRVKITDLLSESYEESLTNE